MARSSTDYETTLRKDASESYAKVAARGQSKVSACGDLQRLARAFLKWDKTAEKAPRRDLQRFATMSLTEENCSWQTTVSFQDAFASALASSAQNDKPEAGELYDSETKEAANQKIRAAFAEAISADATADTIKRAMDSVKGD